MGDYHAAAISTDGTLYTWGSNLDGQLGTGGLGDTTDEETGATLQLTPTVVSLPAAVSNVAVGAGHTAAILSDGTLWTWGRNDAMQLGLTEAGAQVWEPGQVVELVPAQAVSAGTDQTVCLLTDGEVQASWAAARPRRRPRSRTCRRQTPGRCAWTSPPRRAWIGCRWCFWRHQGLCWPLPVW